MIALHPTDLDLSSPDALRAAAVARRFADQRGRAGRSMRPRSPFRASEAGWRGPIHANPLGRALAAARAALAPAVLLPAALLLFGCCALLAVTGVGPASWQARLCAADGPRPASCAALPPGRDAPPAPGRTMGADASP